jgi:hypothetical protein
MTQRYSRRDVLRFGAAVVSGMATSARPAAAQRESPPMTYRVRQRPPTSGRRVPDPLPEGLQRYRDNAEAAVAVPFKGITTDGSPVAGLFPIKSTGVSTRPMVDAAQALLNALGPEQAARARFPLDTDVWRRWSNIHPYIMRHGACLDALTPPQRERALALVEASLSPAGFKVARDVMRLNQVIMDITGRPDEYGEWLYWISVMGTPSSSEPWGWQIDGHHLIVNCLVLGDQVVLTPMFMGSEPVAAHAGPYAGTRVFEAEEQQGLAVLHALDPGQRARAIVSTDLPGEVLTAAFRDNVELKPEGIRWDELSAGQQGLLRRLLDTYLGRIRPGHAWVRSEEVARHLPETRFAWIGGVADDSVFYYRIHSPVILIEFDHQRGIAFDNDQPSRNHIHTVIRTPNGNDYGKDLLRQHHAQYDHQPGRHHVRR